MVLLVVVLLAVLCQCCLLSAVCCHADCGLSCVCGSCCHGVAVVFPSSVVFFIVHALFVLWAQELDTIEPSKSDLDIYLEEGLYICKGNLDVNFDALDWWKANTLKFRILSNMARDLLSIPISTVASESAFSTGGRVLDQYRSSLKLETVQALICGGDWLCSNF
ncbi:hypothetical protein ACSBR1_040257 [Camellia fascicularis]